MTEAILPWQVSQWQQLVGADSEGRLGHALLLSGPGGIGKLRFARALMAWLVCEQPQNQGACGKCRSCHYGLDNPDLHIIEPPEGKKQIAVDQVRELVALSTQTAHRSGGRKVVLVHPADAMNANTANALLKTLEEPSGDTVLILVSNEPARLLPTIRSRCQQLPFPIPNASLALDWLKMSVGDAALAETCLREAGGRPLAAQVLFENDGLAARERCDSLLQAWAAGEQSLSQVIDGLKEVELDFYLEWFAHRIHALLVAVMAEQSDDVNAAWQRWLDRPPAAILSFQKQLLDLRAQVQRGVALNRQLTIESLLLSWAMVCSSANAGLGV